jgi:soluble P-type ATPase
MIKIDVPGFRKLELRHLVLDYNGTLALDGQVLPGVGKKLSHLARDIEIHVVTADTFKLAKTQLAALPVTLTITPAEEQAQAKLQFVSGLGADTVVAIGNGRNDREMLRVAALSVALLQSEGAAAVALSGAHIICTSILDALELLCRPERIVATLRS